MIVSSIVWECVVDNYLLLIKESNMSKVEKRSTQICDHGGSGQGGRSKHNGKGSRGCL